MLITFEITTEENEEMFLKSTLSAAVEAKQIQPFRVDDSKNFEAIENSKLVYNFLDCFTF